LRQSIGSNEKKKVYHSFCCSVALEKYLSWDYDEYLVPFFPPVAICI
jgi:hypothetical protein